MNPTTHLRDDLYLYPIRGDSHDFYTGTTKNGSQLLVVISLPFATAVFFDHEGRLLRSEELYLNDADNTGVFSEVDEQQLTSWLQSLGYSGGMIRVRRFFLPQHNIGILDFPNDFQDMLFLPSFGQEERNFAQRELKRWISEGQFQLCLNPDIDLWIDGSGNITST